MHIESGQRAWKKSFKIEGKLWAALTISNGLLDHALDDSIFALRFWVIFARIFLGVSIIYADLILYRQPHDNHLWIEQREISATAMDFNMFMRSSVTKTVGVLCMAFFLMGAVKLDGVQAQDFDFFYLVQQVHFSIQKKTTENLIKFLRVSNLVIHKEVLTSNQYHFLFVCIDLTVARILLRYRS